MFGPTADVRTRLFSRSVRRVRALQADSCPARLERRSRPKRSDAISSCDASCRTRPLKSNCDGQARSGHQRLWSWKDPRHRRNPRIHVRDTSSRSYPKDTNSRIILLNWSDGLGRVIKTADGRWSAVMGSQSNHSTLPAPFADPIKKVMKMTSRPELRRAVRPHKLHPAGASCTAELELRESRAVCSVPSCIRRTMSAASRMSRSITRKRKRSSGSSTRT